MGKKIVWSDLPWYVKVGVVGGLGYVGLFFLGVLVGVLEVLFAW